MVYTAHRDKERHNIHQAYSFSFIRVTERQLIRHDTKLSGNFLLMLQMGLLPPSAGGGGMLLSLP